MTFTVQARHALYAIASSHLHRLAQGKETSNIDGRKDIFIRNVDNLFYQYSQGTRLRCYMHRDQLKIKDYRKRQIDCFFTTRRNVLTAEEIFGIVASSLAVLFTAGIAAGFLPFVVGAGVGAAATVATPFASLFVFPYGAAIGAASAAGTAAGVGAGIFAGAASAATVAGTTVGALQEAGVLETKRETVTQKLARKKDKKKVKREGRKYKKIIDMSLASSVLAAGLTSLVTKNQAAKMKIEGNIDKLSLQKYAEERYKKGGADYMHFYQNKVTALSAMARFNLADINDKALFVQYRLPGDRLSKNRYFLNRTILFYKLSKDKAIASRQWTALRYNQKFEYCYKKTNCKKLRGQDAKDCEYSQRLCKQNPLRFKAYTNNAFRLLSPLGNKKDRVFLTDGVEVHATKTYAPMFDEQIRSR